jgi:TonB family protein
MGETNARKFQVLWITGLLLSGLTHIRAQSTSAQNADSSQKQPSAIYRVGNGVSAPRATYAPSPEYSEEARKANYQGTCVLSLVVGPDGLPRDVGMKRSLGLGLDEKALQAVRSWRFAPATKDGMPVTVQIDVEVSFSMFQENTKFGALVKKANDGDAKAQFEMSQVLFSGREQPRNDALGFQYLEKAAKNGMPKAQFAMGEYFASHGNDFVNAYVWYSLAERNHYKANGKRLKELSAKMTTEELSDANKRLGSPTP